MLREASGIPQKAEQIKNSLKPIEDYNRFFEKMDALLNNLLTHLYDDKLFKSDSAKHDYVFNRAYRFLKDEYDAAKVRGDVKVQQEILYGSSNGPVKVFNQAKNEEILIFRLEDVEIVAKDNLTYYSLTNELELIEEIKRIIAYIKAMKTIQNQNQKMSAFGRIQNTDYRFYSSIRKANDVLLTEKEEIEYGEEYRNAETINKTITDRRIRKKLG